MGGLLVPVFNRHVTRRQVRYAKRDVEQKNESRPNVDTATRPCDKTSGSGINVLELLLRWSVMMRSTSRWWRRCCLRPQRPNTEETSTSNCSSGSRSRSSRNRRRSKKKSEMVDLVHIQLCRTAMKRKNVSESSPESEG